MQAYPDMNVCMDMQAYIDIDRGEGKGESSGIGRGEKVVKGEGFGRNLFGKKVG